MIDTILSPPVFWGVWRFLLFACFGLVFLYGKHVWIYSISFQILSSRILFNQFYLLCALYAFTYIISFQLSEEADAQFCELKIMLY